MRLTHVPIVDPTQIVQKIWENKQNITKIPGGVLIIEAKSYSRVGRVNYDTSNQALRLIHFKTMSNDDRKFTKALVRIWHEHDQNEMVLCLIERPKEDQILVYPKPWTAQTQKHCGCGAVQHKCSLEKRH